MTLSVRVRFSRKSEVREARRVVRIIAKALKNRGYVVRVNDRIYWDTRKCSGKDCGGRIYIVVEVAENKKGKRSTQR